MQEKNYVTYEYRTITVKAKEQTRAMDMYEAFGWEISSISPTFADGVTLSLKRDRKQKHRLELTKLERQAENLCETINSLRRAKTLGASIFACIFGIIASLILGGGMSLVMLTANNIPAFIGGIAIGTAGIIMCSVTYPIYKKMVAGKTKQLSPVIDDNEEKLAGILEKGNDILGADII